MKRFTICMMIFLFCSAVDAGIFARIKARRARRVHRTSTEQVQIGQAQTICEGGECSLLPR